MDTYYVTRKGQKFWYLKKMVMFKYTKSDTTENINKAFCLRDISTMKVLYKALKEKDLVGEMDIVDIQELYGKG